MEISHSQTIYSGRAFTIRIDHLRMPDGKLRQLDIVQHNPAVTMLPVDDLGRVWFVRQYRHPAGLILLELPAGVMEAGEAPDSSAMREIQEEIGMAAKSLQHIGGFFLAPGYSTEYMHVFLASDLYPHPLPGDEDEFLEIEKVPISQIENLVKRGEIQDAKTLSALYLAIPYLNRWSAANPAASD